MTTLLFLGLMIVLWPAYGGSQWGARYLLPAYPLLLFLAFYTYSRWRDRKDSFAPIVRQIFFSLLVVSVALQLSSVRLLFQKHAAQMATKEAIASLPTDLILTNHPFLPSFMSSLEEKKFMYVDSEDDLRRLLPRFAAHDINRFALVTVEGIELEPPADLGLRQIAPLVYQIE
jgi:hypothetical protein